MTNARALATLKQMRTRLMTALNNPKPGQCKEQTRQTASDLQAIDVAIIQLSIVHEQEIHNERLQAARKAISV